MTNQFKWIDSRSLTRKRGASVPYCSISFEGSRRIYINAEASEKLPTKYVKVGLDEENKRMAIKPVDEQNGGFELYTKAPHNTNIHSAPIVHQISEMTGYTKGTRKFPAKWDSDLNALIVYLKQEID